MRVGTTVSSSIKDACGGLRIGQHKVRCPECQGQRKNNRSDKPLSVSVDSLGVRYHCHHCGVSGGWVYKTSAKFDRPRPNEPKAKPITLNNMAKTNGRALEFMHERQIPQELIDSHVILDTYSFGGERMDAIGFPYRKDGEVVAIKWRSAEGKRFSQQNKCSDFYNIENYQHGNDLLICEGELDALSWMASGLPDNISVVSIPNGAPPKVRDGKIDPADDNKFRYVWNAKSKIESAPRIIFNTDNDGPGEALREELVRRIGRSKAWTVSLNGYKDASEALREAGEGFLQSQLAGSIPIPAVGLHTADVFDKQFIDLYEKGQAKGASTGIEPLDKLIQIPTGMLTVVTGFPSSGKSDLVDQMCLNFAQRYDWKTVYCSFEKPPELHMAQLAQKIVGKPFFDGATDKMTPEERDFAFQWINKHFLFMDYRKDGPSDIESILEIASAAVMRMGCRVLVIDPYNYLTVPSNLRETDAISQILTKIQLWAKEHDAHVFFVAHPTKISPDRRSERKTIVTGHDIAGSAAWFAKADIGLSAWRHPRDEEPPDAHVWKVRWSWLGRNGSCPLNFDKPTGRWSAYSHEDDDFDWDF